jgi:phytoene dehydrogenase-like protein
MSGPSYDAVVVGSGPNGLAAAVAIAQAGRSVLVVEAGDTIGGGSRSAELTEPGFVHDVCSAIHPLGAASPFFKTLPLDIDWIHPDLCAAHPLDDGTAVVLSRSISETAASLGPDATRYIRTMGRLVAHAEPTIDGLQRPVFPLPHHPLCVARFALLTARSVATNARALFNDDRGRALLSGTAAHAMVPLHSLPAHGVALLFQLCGHVSGWPLPRGGSQAIPDALAKYLRSIGGGIECGRRVASLRDIPSSRVVLFDLTPRQVIQIAGDELPASYKRRLSRFKYGPGVFKIDYALNGPVPWKAADAGRAGTVHLGGTYEEVAESERLVTHGEHPERPWVIVAQQSAFDDSRAPAGKHTLWVYTHVPAGSTLDRTEAIENQLERFAPGFRDTVIAKRITTPADLERYNANYIGGDIAGGLSNMKQFFTRPIVKLNPYSTPNDRLFMCSSSTPPGAGVHGMCGWNAARTAIAKLR